LLWLGHRNPDYRRRWGERFGYIEARENAGACIWIHAVSVGEAQAARPLVDFLSSQHPDFDIIVTTTTPTGAQIVRNTMGTRVTHFYFPYDLPGAVARFLARARPQLLVLMETELWPNLLQACSNAGVKVLLANARLSAKSQRGYASVSSLTRTMLKNVSAIAAQTRLDAERFAALGAPDSHVVVTGSMKFDVGIAASVIEQAQSVRRDLGSERPVWIAASTHNGEEATVIDAFVDILQEWPACLLILAPRHPERASRICELCSENGLSLATRKSHSRLSASTQVLVLDSMGELPVFYAAADIAFVGGSIVPLGGHNVLEPAALGLPTVVGPHMQNFAEIFDILRAAGGIFTITDAASLSRKLDELFRNPEMRSKAGDAARAVVESNRGASRKVAALAEHLIAA